VNPIPDELASTNNKNGSLKFGYAKIGADTKARFSLSKAPAHDSDQQNLTPFLVKALRGLAIVEKPFTKRL